MSLGLLGPDLEPAGAAALEGVGFGRRALARGIDLGVHLFVSLATGVATGLLLVVAAAVQGGSPDAALEKISVETFPGFVAAIVGATALHVLGEGLHGSTLGKRLCGIVVVAEDGGPSTLAGALKRNLAYFVDGLFFGLVAYNKMSESSRRQRIGDVWGHTMVVRISSLDASARRSTLRFLLASAAGLSADGLVIFLELASKLI